jgi:hypothetical protein
MFHSKSLISVNFGRSYAQLVKGQYFSSCLYLRLSALREREMPTDSVYLEGMGRGVFHSVISMYSL